MQKSIHDPLRPYGMLELLDRAFRIYRNNFLVFAGMVAIVIVPLTAVQYFVTLPITNRLSASLETGRAYSSADTSSMLSNLLGVYGILLLLSLVAALIQGIVVNGTLTYMASEQHFGRQVTIGEAFSAVRDRLLSLGLGLVLFYVIVIGATIVLAFTLFACGIGFGVLIYLWVTLYAFLTPVYILERTSVMDGLGRAWMLGKARVWPAFGVMAVIFLITAVLSFALSLATQLITQQNVASVSLTASQAIQIVLQTAVTIFLTPVLPVALTLMYYDARVRVEGLDIALQATGKPDARPADVMSPPASGFMSGQDYRNVGILCAVMFVLIILYFGLSFLLVGSMARTTGGF